jgi:acyl transferase domain-containing protein
VDRVSDFDAVTFQFSAGEATAMDPQTRIALEQTQASDEGLEL